MTELLERAEAYERLKMSHMSTSDRVKASREGKEIVLGINEFYKKTKDSALMDWMKLRDNRPVRVCFPNGRIKVFVPLFLLCLCFLFRHQNAATDSCQAASKPIW